MKKLIIRKKLEQMIGQNVEVYIDRAIAQFIPNIMILSILLIMDI